jgi:endonuclease/exonuclease/phosphatase family metal-dependent hydrolase
VQVHRKSSGAPRWLLSRAWLWGIVLVSLVLAHARWGAALRVALDLPGERVPVPDRAGALRVISWNLRNFPRTDAADRVRPDEGPHDRVRMVAQLRSLDADVIAVQEVKDPAALRSLMPGWSMHLSEEGGRGHQRLGLLFDPARVDLVAGPREHEDMSGGGRVRPALSATLRRRADGSEFAVVVVHLKSRPSGYALRQTQWKTLAAIIASIESPTVVVMGDFNATGPARARVASAALHPVALELAALDEIFGALGLIRLENEGGCSAYWEGRQRDAWKEPSLLDLVWLRSAGRPSIGLTVEQGATDPLPVVHALAHCARYRCQPFRTTRAHPELDFTTMSDHCPLLVDL